MGDGELELLLEAQAFDKVQEEGATVVVIGLLIGTQIDPEGDCPPILTSSNEALPNFTDGPQALQPQ